MARIAKAKINHVGAKWAQTTLGEVLNLEYGKPLPKERRADNGAFPVYGANGIKCRTNDVYWEKPSIVVGRKGSAGEINIAAGGFWPLDVSYFVVFEESEYDLRFLYYLLSRLDLPSLAKGVKPGLNRNDVYAIKQYFPPLSEQQRIGTILDEAFSAIATAAANTEKNLANARELFDSALNRVFQTPQFTEDSAEDGVAEGWHETTLGEVCEFRRGLTYKKADEVPISQNAVLRANNITVETGEINYDEIRFIRGEIEIPASKIVVPGSLLVCTASGSKKHLGKIGLVEDGSDYAFGGFMGLLVPSGKALPKYLFHLTRSNLYRDFIDTLSDGVNINNLKWSQLSQFQIPLPPLPEQQRIVTFLDKLSAEKQTLVGVYETKLSALAELKQSLLHQAFTGELTADPKAADRSLSEACI